MNSAMKTLLSSVTIAALSFSTLAENIAIVGGTAFTMASQGKVENATVLLKDGKIESVKSGGSVPSGYRTIDAKDKIVTPGIIGAYTQLGLVEVEYSAGITDSHASVKDMGSIGSSLDVSYAINSDSSLINITRIEGITSAGSTIVDSDTMFHGQGSVITLGDKTSPLLKSRAFMVVDVTGDKADSLGGTRAALWPSLIGALDAAASLRGKNLRAKDEWHGDISKADVNALIPVVNGNIPLLTIAHSASDLRQVIALKSRYKKLRPVITGGTEAWRVADELASADIPVLMDPERNLPYGFAELGATLSNAKRLHDAGVKLVFGVGIGLSTHNVRLVTQHAGNAVANGLPWEAGLAAITKNVAEIYGMDKQIGSLSKGKRADVVVWSGDPLEVMSYAEQVIIAGEEIKMESRQTLLEKRYRNLGQTKPYRYNKP